MLRSCNLQLLKLLVNLQTQDFTPRLIHTVICGQENDNDTSSGTDELLS